ncbi:hypothetical protein EDB81DRAFT_813956 [Dactylonectria macrodidyma]|uniref:Zn(2)-C6 fungal-type domain-containing protein n=1 Tax=Dactylonectria macrodidyma TaxID=307937 RepID=A0A9P9II54_9HYPO|nr:hypothetical protein EDB81DRAFT_813956 [Dactylonectria macrodidyma]
MAPTRPTRSSTARRACDSCKRRKVKCDSADPCANCRISSLACEYTGVNRNRGSPKVVPVSSNVGEFTLATSSLPGDHEHQSHLIVETGQPALFESENKSTSQELGPSQSLQPSGSVALSLALGALRSADSAASAQAIRDALLVSIRGVMPSMHITEIVNGCIRLFMQYIFPSTPIVHENTLRAEVSICFSDVSSATLFGVHDEQMRVARMRGFSLITAVCASVASVMPESLLPYGHFVASLFFRASQHMLKCYEEYDLEHPNSSSLIIRDLHYTASQHITGKKGVAFHVIGQATLIAQALHLYSEQSIAQHSTIEGQLLRLCFWHLYLSDKAAICHRTRPCVLHELLFSSKLTLHPLGEPMVPLLDVSNPLYGNSFEERLLVGYGLVVRLWSSSATLLVEMSNFDIAADDKEAVITKLTSLYFDFNSIMDDFPNWLQVSSIMSSLDDGAVRSFQNTSFWVQRCTLTMTYHCLRLMILQQCIACGLQRITGLSEQPVFVMMKKAELIQDFIQTMEDIPFLYHQIKGEPSVERIRQVGTIILEMIQNISGDPIKARLETYFGRLLDVLSKLNSKASEGLC